MYLDRLDRFDERFAADHFVVFVDGVSFFFYHHAAVGLEFGAFCFEFVQNLLFARAVVGVERHRDQRQRKARRGDQCDHRKHAVDREVGLGKGHARDFRLLELKDDQQRRHRDRGDRVVELGDHGVEREAHALHTVPRLPFEIVETVADHGIGQHVVRPDAEPAYRHKGECGEIVDPADKERRGQKDRRDRAEDEARLFEPDALVRDGRQQYTGVHTGADDQIEQDEHVARLPALDLHHIDGDVGRRRHKQIARRSQHRGEQRQQHGSVLCRGSEHLFDGRLFGVSRKAFFGVLEQQQIADKDDRTGGRRDREIYPRRGDDPLIDADKPYRDQRTYRAERDIKREQRRPLLGIGRRDAHKSHRRHVDDGVGEVEQQIADRRKRAPRRDGHLGKGQKHHDRDDEDEECAYPDERAHLAVFGVSAVDDDAHDRVVDHVPKSRDEHQRRRKAERDQQYVRQKHRQIGRHDRRDHKAAYRGEAVGSLLRFADVFEVTVRGLCRVLGGRIVIHNFSLVLIPLYTFWRGHYKQMGVNSLIVKCKFSVKFILPPNARRGAKEQKR